LVGGLAIGDQQTMHIRCSQAHCRDNSDGRDTASQNYGDVPMTKPNREQLHERAESIFRTVTPLERADAMDDYKARREAERQRMLELRRLRMERDEAGE
jgi:hypothetical protein